MHLRAVLLQLLVEGFSLCLPAGSCWLNVGTCHQPPADFCQLPGNFTALRLHSLQHPGQLKGLHAVTCAVIQPP